MLKIINNEVVSPYSSRSVLYNAVVSGSVGLSGNGVWLAKNCARVKRRLKVRAELCCVSTISGHSAKTALLSVDLQTLRLREILDWD